MESVRMACAATAPGLETVEVLLRCRQGTGTKTQASVTKKLKNLGFHIHSLVEGSTFVASGTISLDQIEDLLAEDWVEAVESSHQMYCDLDLSGLEVGFRPLQTVVPTIRGTNVLMMVSISCMRIFVNRTAAIVSGFSGTS